MYVVCTYICVCVHVCACGVYMCVCACANKGTVKPLWSLYNGAVRHAEC